MKIELRFAIDIELLIDALTDIKDGLKDKFTTDSNYIIEKVNDNHFIIWDNPS